MITKQRFFRPFILVMSLLVVGFIVFILYDSLTFRLTSTTPKLNDKTPSSISRITLNFNKKVDPGSISEKSITSDGLVRNFSVEDKSIIFTVSSLKPETLYRFTIRDVRSTSGKVIQELSFEFTPRYVEFGKLPEDIQQQQVQDTDPQSSLNSILPYETDYYYIDFWEQQKEIVISIEMKFSYPDQTNQKYLDSVRKHRKEAFTYLKDRGVTTEDYKYFYTEQVLLDEFPAQAKQVEEEEFTGDGAPPEELGL